MTDEAEKIECLEEVPIEADLDLLTTDERGKEPPYKPSILNEIKKDDIIVKTLDGQVREVSVPEDLRTPENILLKRRSGVYPGRALKGHITEGRESWVTVMPFEAVCFIGDEPDYVEAHPKVRVNEVPAVKIELRFPGKKTKLKVDLTAMTALELKALAGFFTRVYKMAMPLCEELDKKAAEAFEAGDDTYIRMYRPDPIIWIREEKEDGTRIAVPKKVE